MIIFEKSIIKVTIAIINVLKTIGNVSRELRCCLGSQRVISMQGVVSVGVWSLDSAHTAAWSCADRGSCSRNRRAFMSANDLHTDTVSPKNR